MVTNETSSDLQEGSGIWCNTRRSQGKWLSGCFL